MKFKEKLLNFLFQDDLEKIEKALFKEERVTNEFLPPISGIPEYLKEYLVEGRLVEPVIIRKDYIAKQWTYVNECRSKRPFTTSHAEIKSDPTNCPLCSDRTTPRDIKTGGDKLRIENEEGCARVFYNLFPYMPGHYVILETDKHKEKIHELNEGEILNGLLALTEVCKEYEKNSSYPIAFKNQGKGGASLAHTHMQTGALKKLPYRVEEEFEESKRFFKRYRKNIYDCIIDLERERDCRFITEDDNIAVLAPFAPKTNYEVWLVFKKPYASLTEADRSSMASLSKYLSAVTKSLSEMGISDLNVLYYQVPPVEKHSKAYRLHVKVLPFKFLAGFERGFDEYAIEVLPEKTAKELKGAIDKFLGC